jgi:3-methyl-2-oxobutanoate hydroxymethyltransferase
MTSTYSLKEMKKEGIKICMLTAYDYISARVCQESGIDIILVGDSLGNTVLGYENTIPVTVEEMLHHTKAVVRGAKSSFVVVDMPFMSYQINSEQALSNAARFIKEAGAAAVKIEGSKHVEAIKKLVEAGIPVMGHIGFTPQSVNQLGGYRVQGRSLNEIKELIEAAKNLEKAGVFAIVLEMVPAMVAEKVTKAVEVPVIGCGAGQYCDGQVLVINDILGMTPDFTPRFAKKYADIYSETKKAVTDYLKEVKSGTFPSKENSFI